MVAVELFAGVGGFRLGLERAGHTVAWANEWDKYAADTYDKNFNKDGQNGISRADITTIDPAEIPAHDLIVGGFPCQAFSVAGKRRGFDETRGTLFFEILRIARHHRTRYLLLENVKGLLNHDRGRTFGVMLRALDESGYDVHNGRCLTLKTSASPKTASACSLSDILEANPDPKYFLSEATTAKLLARVDRPKGGPRLLQPATPRTTETAPISKATAPTTRTIATMTPRA